ncbi:hypothetical protein SORBI_3003G367401 [Sorghum bicolor]|uniref:Uncharacterized protein n=1 Tax=Sorghum bicolor TaxID=4558 RepID=A0A1W0W0L4_SORBI|nr:hypothetical protein SORBI_3003G367401 [Sorghum bicolor]
MRRASWMSLGMMVTRLAWMAQRLVSSKSPTSAATAELWKRRRWNGSLRISSSVLFWYLRISRSATVPGRKRWGFFTPPVAGADLRAAFVASCFLGALPPVDFLAVCFVRAIEGTCGRESGKFWGQRRGLVEGNGVSSVGLEEDGRPGLGLRLSTRIVAERSVGMWFLRSDWLEYEEKGGVWGDPWGGIPAL